MKKTKKINKPLKTGEKKAKDRKAALKRYFDNENYQPGLRLVLISVLGFLIVIGANILMGNMPEAISNVDISASNVLTLTSAEKEDLSNVSQEITMYYICEDGDENSNTVAMLEMYSNACQYIQVVPVDPAYESDLVVSYVGEITVENNSIIVVSGERQQLINYSDYYSSSAFVLNDYLDSAISYVTSNEFLIAYGLTGHGEVELSSSTIAYMGLDGFTYEELNLVEAGSVPDDASLVIINGISSDITAAEAESLIEYLEAGGSLLLVTDYTTKTLSNLDDVTGYFGAHMGNGIIMESDSSRYTDDNPAYLFPTIYTDNAVITAGIDYVLMPNTKPITVDDEDDVVFTNLLETTENSYAVYTNIFTGDMDYEVGPHTVAGSFEKADGDEGKMIWITSKYISDATVSEAVGGGNITFFLNSICWLGEDEPVASVHSKKVSSQYLTFNTNQLTIYSIIIIAIIPLIPLLIGIVVYIRRRRRV